MELLFLRTSSLDLRSGVPSSSELEESSKLDRFLTTTLFFAMNGESSDPDLGYSDSSRVDRRVLNTGEGGSLEEGESVSLSLEVMEGIRFFNGEFVFELLSTSPKDLFNGPG